MSSSVLVFAFIGLIELSGAQVVKTLKVNNSLTLEGKRFEQLHSDISTILYKDHSGVSKKLNPLVLQKEIKISTPERKSDANDWNIIQL
jgi:hypothetical protein